MTTNLPSLPNATKLEVNNILKFCQGLIFKNINKSENYETVELAIASYNLINAIFKLDIFAENGQMTEAERINYIVGYSEKNEYYKKCMTRMGLSTNTTNLTEEQKIELAERIVQIHIAEDHDVIYYPTGYLSDVEVKMFLDFYKENLAYYNTVLHSDGLKYYNKYWNYVNFVVTLMTIDRFVTYKMDTIHDVDLFSEREVRNMFASYGLEFFEEVPMVYRKRLLKNLNYLLEHKGTDQVIIRIISLFGFEDINLFKYYLIKDLKRDESFPRSDIKNNIKNFESETEKIQPDLKFLKVKVTEKELENIFVSPATEKVNYEVLTSLDPFWEASKDEIATKDFNKLNTKYLGVEIGIDLYKLTHQFSFFYNYLKNFKKSDDSGVNSQLKILNSQISADPIHLVDALIALNYLALKHLGYEDTILYSMENIAYLNHVWGFNPEDSDKWDPELTYYENMINILGYKTEKVLNENTEKYEYYIIPVAIPERQIGTNVLWNPDIDAGGPFAKPSDFLRSFNENYELFLKHRNDLINENDYTAFQKKMEFFQAKFIQEINNDVYKGHEKLSDYLQEQSPDLFTYIESDLPNKRISDLIVVLEDFLLNIENVENKYIEFDNSLLVLDFTSAFIRKIISIFKAYTTQFIGMNAYFVYSDELLETVKLREKILQNKSISTGEWIKKVIPNEPEPIPSIYTFNCDYQTELVTTFKEGIYPRDRFNIVNKLGAVRISDSYLDFIDTFEDGRLKIIYGIGTVSILVDDVEIISIVLNFENNYINIGSFSLENTESLPANTAETGYYEFDGNLLYLCSNGKRIVCIDLDNEIISFNALHQTNFFSYTEPEYFFNNFTDVFWQMINGLNGQIISFFKINNDGIFYINEILNIIQESEYEY
jgi:hypothetical protein